MSKVFSVIKDHFDEFCYEIGPFSNREAAEDCFKYMLEYEKLKTEEAIKHDEDSYGHWVEMNPFCWKGGFKITDYGGNSSLASVLYIFECEAPEVYDAFNPEVLFKNSTL